MQLTQKLSLNKTSAIISVVSLLLMIGVPFIVCGVILPEFGGNIPGTEGIVKTVVFSVAFFALTLACLGVLLFMPLRIEVDNASFTVSFSLRSRVFPLRDIAEVEPYADKGMMMRICGSGAFFGWWGWFRTKSIGKFMMYATRLDNLLLIKLADGRKYVVSCSDVPAMARAIAENCVNLHPTA